MLILLITLAIIGRRFQNIMVSVLSALCPGVPIPDGVLYPMLGFMLVYMVVVTAHNLLRNVIAYALYPITQLGIKSFKFFFVSMEY